LIRNVCHCEIKKGIDHGIEEDLPEKKRKIEIPANDPSHQKTITGDVTLDKTRLPLPNEQGIDHRIDEDSREKKRKIAIPANLPSHQKTITCDVTVDHRLQPSPNKIDHGIYEVS